MLSSGDFLGLQHDFATTHNSGHVQFWVRARSQTKIQDMIQSIYAIQKLAPGVASKFYGLLTFLNTGGYGKLGRSSFECA